MNNFVVEHFKSSMPTITEIENELEEISLDNINWLLVYEAVVKKWFSNAKIEIFLVVAIAK